MDSYLEPAQVVNKCDVNDSTKLSPRVRLTDRELVGTRTLTIARHIIRLNLFALGAFQILLSERAF